MPRATILPLITSIIAQAQPDQASWERLGIAGLSISATVFIWRFYTAKEKEDRIADAAERNRLLAENVELNKRVVELLMASAAESKSVAKALLEHEKNFSRMHEDSQRSIKDLARKIPIAREVTVVNSPDHPVHTTGGG